MGYRCKSSLKKIIFWFPEAFLFYGSCLEGENSSMSLSTGQEGPAGLLRGERKAQLSPEETHTCLCPKTLKIHSYRPIDAQAKQYPTEVPRRKHHWPGPKAVLSLPPSPPAPLDSFFPCLHLPFFSPSLQAPFLISALNEASHPELPSNHLPGS